MLEGAWRPIGPEEVVYGRPAAAEIKRLAERWGARRILLCTTASLAHGLAARLADELGRLVVGRYSAISAHSPRQAVIEGAAEARRVDADLILALGGSSVVDAAKVMQLALWADVDTAEGLDRVRGRAAADLAPGVRMVAIPTTLSAAEFTPFAGVTDPKRRVKEGFAHPALAPRAVILDAAAAVGTPERLWLSTGMKAVDHAVEALVSLHRSPMADALAAEGLAKLAAGLPASREAPADLEARQECQLGAWLAMSGAMAGRGLGASHAIGHTLGGTYGVPHGITSCVALPAVLRWTLDAAPERQALVARLLGRQEVSAAEAVERLARDLRLPTRLCEIGVRREDFEAIAEHTMHDAGVRSSPRPIAGPADIVEILELAWR